jgi:hypothetical protein
MSFLIFPALYLALSLLVAMMGDDRKFGFWGYFFASMWLTPVVGFLLMIASNPIPLEGDKEGHAESEKFKR